MEAALSVQAQTFERWEHLIWVDREYQGCSRTVNHLAGLAQGDWLLLLADDDLLLPGAIESLLAVSDGADIVYSPPLVSGEDGAQFHGSPPFIPSTALIRRSLWEQLGGYDVGLDRTEDRDLYERAIIRNAVFRRVDEPCWVYRFHGGNKSRGHRPWIHE